MMLFKLTVAIMALAASGSVDASRCKPDPRNSSSEVSEATGTTTSDVSLSSSSTYDSSTGRTTFEQAATTSSIVTTTTTLTETESSTTSDLSSTSSNVSTTTDTTRSDSLTTVTSSTETFTSTSDISSTETFTSTSGVSSTESVISTTETSTDSTTETSATETTTTQSTSEISTTTTTTAEYCVPTDLNYIQNPGFEKVNDRGSVDFSPWVLQNDWTHVTASDSLAHGQGELFVGIQVNDNSMPKRSVSQTVNGLVVGKQYTLSYYWMVYNGYPPNTISCYHEVSIEVSPWREYNDIIKGFEPRYWEQHEYTFPAVFEQQTISIIVYCDQPVTDKFFVFLDDFKLRPAGELCSDG